MGTGLASVVLSMFLAQAPPSTMAQWKAKWLDPPPQVNMIVLSAADRVGSFQMCARELEFIRDTGSPVDSNEAGVRLRGYTFIHWFRAE